MSAALTQPGDIYRAPDGILYSLIQTPAVDNYGDTLGVVSPTGAVDEEVLRFENLPRGSSGTRGAVVRWSDGSEGETLTWYADEIMVCEADLLGETREQPRALHFRRDRDWLQS